MNDYEWMRQRRRMRRQEELANEETELDDRLEDGFSLMQDDDDLTDDTQSMTVRKLSGEADGQYENRRKRAEL